jgi:ParB/RepB/Spo0J family partition protein
MRLRYPLADVRRMALSQAERARRGLDPCIQPLIITPCPTPLSLKGRCVPRSEAEWGGAGGEGEGAQQYYIIAGHLRHAGNVYLKGQAPLLNCLVRHYPDEAAMLAEMRGENGVRADISPLGWARHYHDSLAADSTLTIQRLVRESGKSLHFVQEHLRLLELAAEAQALIDNGSIHFGALEHLLKLPTAQLQAQAASRFARRHSSLTAIQRGVEALLAQRPPKHQRLVKTERIKPEAAPAVPATVGLPADLPANLKELRVSAATTCALCSEKPRGLAEPAWHLALSAAGETCVNCDLRTIKGACGGCPLPEMLSRLVRTATGLRPQNGNGLSH